MGYQRDKVCHQKSKLARNMTEKERERERERMRERERGERRVMGWGKRDSSRQALGDKG
jgi:hypothetical protein